MCGRRFRTLVANVSDLEVDDPQPATRICTSCGATLRADAKFCATCGNWMGALEPSEVPNGPGRLESVEADDDDLDDDLDEPNELGERAELDELQQPDEIEEVTELRPHNQQPRSGVQPVSLSREPMSIPRRVLVALTLLVLCAAIAFALRSVG
jgi:hypothetical protein